MASRRGAEPGPFAHQTQQEVLCSEVVVLPFARFFLCDHDDLPRALVEQMEHDPPYRRLDVHLARADAAMSYCHGMTALKVLAGTGFAAVALLAGCSGVVNLGGDTKCKDFIAAEEQKQNDAVSKMVKDERGRDASNLEISATRTAVTMYCKTLGNDNSKIREAPHI